MKRLAIVLGSIFLVAALAYPVFSRSPDRAGRHMMGHSGGGPGFGGWYGGGYGNLTEEQRTQLNNLHKSFNSEITGIRNEIRTKSNELETIFNMPTPDLDKARGLQKEINNLRDKMAEKRLTFELAGRKIAPNGGYDRWCGDYEHHMEGYASHMGHGSHMGGYGPGGCWN